MKNIKSTNEKLSVMVGKMSGSGYPLTQRLAQDINNRIGGGIIYRGQTIYYGNLKMAETHTDGRHINVKLLPVGKKAKTASVSTHRGLSYKQAMKVINQHVTENIPNAN